MGWEHRPPSEIQLGNGTLLVLLDSCGEVEQLFAPNIDALQSKIGSFQTRVVLPTESGEPPVIFPINSESFEVRLQLEKGSQILRVEYQHRHRPLRLQRKIALHPSEPLFLDQWRILEEKAGLLHQSIPWFGNSTSAHCSMYHPSFNGMVHHRGRRWLGIIARSPAQWVRVGHLSNEARYRLWEGDRVHVDLDPRELAGFPWGEVRTSWDQIVQGCATWAALAVGPAVDLEFMVICAQSEQHLGRLIGQLQHLSSQRYLQMVEGMTEKRYFPATAILNRIQDPHVRWICERSIDVLHALQDSQTGALLAAGEVDPHSRLSGGYGYSWPRDGAYVASALDAFGYTDRVEHYFRFLMETQDVSGAWWQRYLATGHAGPSWGRIQIDEPATVLSAAYLHFRKTRDYLWLEQFWPTLERGLLFLQSFLETESPYGQASHDLWEERMGHHAYSLSAVAAAFLTGAQLAGELMQWQAQRKYREIGKRIALTVTEKFTPLHGPAYRSRIGDVWDPTVDVSLLGLIRPFGILNRRHLAAGRIIESIRAHLWHPHVGGVLRYQGDTYRGGNPWILTTLWLGSVELSLGNFAEAKACFDWSISKATPLGMLSEQVHRDSGLPFWVIPLGWSHAMFLLFVKEVLDRKAESAIWKVNGLVR